MLALAVLSPRGTPPRPLALGARPSAPRSGPAGSPTCCRVKTLARTSTKSEKRGGERTRNALFSRSPREAMRHLGLLQGQLDQRVARHHLLGLVLLDPRRDLPGADLSRRRRAPQRIVALQDQRPCCVQAIEFIQVTTRSMLHHHPTLIAYSTHSLHRPPRRALHSCSLARPYTVQLTRSLSVLAALLLHEGHRVPVPC